MKIIRDKGGIFDKGAGQAPQYESIAPARATATAKFVQSFDERAVMNEQPPTISGGPKGSPAIPSLPDAHGIAPKVRHYDEAGNMRADNQILIAETPDSSKVDKDSRPTFGRRVYRVLDGETT